MTVDEVRVDMLTDEVLGQIAEVKSAIQHEFAPNDPAMTIATARSEMSPGPEGTSYRRLVAWREGQLVGTSTLYSERRGANRHVAQIVLEVSPAHRRRGVASALLGTAIRMAESGGATLVAAWGWRTAPTQAFWTTFELPEVQTSRLSRVAVADIDRDQMDEWATTSEARKVGYQLRRFVGSCPKELLPHYLSAQHGMRDAPSDDVDLEPEPIDERHARAREVALERRRGSVHAIVALDPSGEAAGMTEVVVFDHKPWHIAQQGTTTLPSHRRRGLGRWLKAEMYQHIVAELSGAVVIETGNADSNAPMLAINNEMGFVPYVEFTTRQADLETVQRALRRKAIQG